MFKLVDKPEFTHTVHVMVPSDGGHSEQSFKARLRVLPTSEVAEFDSSTSEGIKDFLRAIWIGAEDLVDPEDRPLPWSDGLRDAMLDLPYVRGNILRTYMDAITKVRMGN